MTPRTKTEVRRDVRYLRAVLRDIDTAITSGNAERLRSECMELSGTAGLIEDYANTIDPEGEPL